MSDGKIAVIALSVLVGGAAAWVGLIFGAAKLFEDDFKAGRRSWMANKSVVDPETGKPWEK